MATLGFYLSTGAAQPLSTKPQPTTANSASIVLDTLATLGKEQPANIATLASKTGIEAAALAPILSDLHRNGLIDISDGPAYRLNEYGEKMRFLVAR